MRVSSIDYISQQYDQFGIGYNRRNSSGGVRMKQVVRAGLSRYVLTAGTHLRRKIGTVPVVALSEVKIEIVYFLGKGWLHVSMLHQELVKKNSVTLLRSDNSKLGNVRTGAVAHLQRCLAIVGFLDASLHNPRFLSQVRVYYKPT